MKEFSMQPRIPQARMCAYIVCQDGLKGANENFVVNEWFTPENGFNISKKLQGAASFRFWLQLAKKTFEAS